MDRIATALGWCLYAWVRSGLGDRQGPPFDDLATFLAELRLAELQRQGSLGL